jgi:hypothetical protein
VSTLTNTDPRKKLAGFNGSDPCPLDAIAAFLKRFIAYPTDHAHHAHVAWIAHTHMIEAFETTPRLAFLSPEWGSGKTRALEVTELLVPRPMLITVASTASIFSMISDDDDGLPVILYDEVDALFSPRAKGNEDLQALFNNGYRRGTVVPRVDMQGKKRVLLYFPAFAPIAFAGLGNLPDTLLSRSVVVRMRRRAMGERVEPFRRRLYTTEGHQLRDRLATWAASIVDAVGESWPALPAGIEDRAADVWEPLIAIADAAGGHWPRHVREAAVALVALSQSGAASLGVQLLTDLRDIFGDATFKATEDVIASLVDLPESPWKEINRGNPLNAHRLGRMLKPYEVQSGQNRDGEKNHRGYFRADLADAWNRYLPPRPHESAASANRATPAQPEHRNAADVALSREREGEPSERRTCVDCGAPLDPPNFLYCAKHGGARAAAGNLSAAPHRRRIVVCTGCDLPRSSDDRPCPTCGAIERRVVER